MSSRVLPRILVGVSVVVMVLSIAGFVATLVFNSFFDKYDAYGEVPIPESQTLHLPAGQVAITFHAVLPGGSGGAGLTVPPLGVSIIPPEGVPDPVVTESFGSSTTVNNDARRRVWLAQIPAEGDYQIKTDGKVSAYVDPRLAFGKTGSAGPPIGVPIGAFVVSLVTLIAGSSWVRRSGRSAPVGFQQPVDFGTPTWTPSDTPTWTAGAAPPRDPGQSSTPTDDGVRIEQLKTLASLRDSGALTQAEFEAEKKRVLGG